MLKRIVLPSVNRFMKSFVLVRSFVASRRFKVGFLSRVGKKQSRQRRQQYYTGSPFLLSLANWVDLFDDVPRYLCFCRMDFHSTKSGGKAYVIRS